ncbi:hypothetical protein GCM10022212_20180 [Actimicrobium antarcticum]|uniref:Uncharacterized protein n=1 Tax=Actimicrobium antarcticum TaxID=1051899 RepID=A0ABP7T910_9BURK
MMGIYAHAGSAERAARSSYSDSVPRTCPFSVWFGVSGFQGNNTDLKFGLFWQGMKV